MESNQAAKVTPAAADKEEREAPTMTQPDTDWQASKRNMKERNAFMFNNELLADVHFVVGSGSTQRRIPAHKYMLVTGSSVFYAMFYGELAETSQEISIPDVEPQAFLNLLSYLYCDDASIGADNVLSTMYAAKKYIMPHLVRKCVKYLETNIDADNACLLLSHSRIFDEPELMKRCLEFIDSWTEEALQSDSFIDIDYQTLEQILSRDTLSAKETAVYTAATRWAEAECTRQGRDTSPQQCREVLGEALYLIRFPTMTLDEFSKGAARSKLLSKQEIIDLFLYLTTEDKPELQFQTTYRKLVRPYIYMCCQRFRSTLVDPVNYAGGRFDNIQFSVDRNIYVVGFGLYGCRKPGVEYHVYIKLMRNRTILCQTKQTTHSDGSAKTIHVLFDIAVPIAANTDYTASLVLNNDERGHRGSDGMSIVTCGNVNFKFTRYLGGSNGTNVESGQIPEILFFCGPDH